MSSFQKFAPLVFVQFYLSIVLFFFISGPWPWPVNDKNPVYIFLIASQLIMILSYSSSKYLREKIIPSQVFRFRKNQISILFISTLFLNILTQLGRTGTFEINILNSFSDLGLNYTNTLEGRSPLVEYIRIMFSVSLFIFIPLGIYGFKSFSFPLKILFLVSIYIHITTFVLMGTNKGLFDILIFFPWILLVYAIKNRLKINLKKIVLRTFIFGSLFFLVFSFFSETQIKRKGDVGSKAIQNMGWGSLKANQNKPEFISEQNYIGYLALTRYLTHGYYAFSQSFEIDYQNTFPFGSSMFLAENANQILNTDHYTEDGFPGSLERRTGWSYFQQWHSLYSWLVSDFGLFGILIIIFFLSRKLAKYWILCISSSDFLNLAKFLILILIFLYIPANNQVFQSPESFFVFLSLFFIRPVIKIIMHRE